MTLFSRLATVAIIAAVGLASPSLANAQDRGRLLPPTQNFDGLTGGEMLGAAWSYLVALPLPENPSFGGGDETCVRFGDSGKLLMAYGLGAHCTVERGTTFFVNGLSGWCSSAEKPPYFGADEQAQRECVLAYLLPLVESVQLTVDGGPPVDLHTSRYAIFAPQQTVDLPPANFLRLQPQTITLTPYGWEAWLTKLPVGRHTIEADTRFTDGSPPHITVHVIDVI